MEMANLAVAGNKRARFEVQLDRHEAKYVIPPSMVRPIVEFIEPFCEPDPNGTGTPPEYEVITLQLDSPDLALHRAKEQEAISRFKLRVRTYGPPGSAPVFLEVKKKFKRSIVKNRAMVPYDTWCRDLVFNPRLEVRFRSSTEESGFLEFVRLAREIAAEPVVLIRYTRESYFSKFDQYARVSFDRRLQYQPATDWEGWGQGRRWTTVDSGLAQRKMNPFSGVVLELKTLSDTPMWMVDLVERFGLERTGNCKYSTAVWHETLFSGGGHVPLMYEDEFRF